MSIDTQGFNATAIRTDAQAVARKTGVLKGAEGRVQSAVKANARANTNKIATSAIAAKNARREEKLDKSIRRYRSVGGFGNKLFMGEFMLGGAAAWLGRFAIKRNWARLGTALHGPKAFFEALNKTSLRDMLELPANVVKEFQKHAANAGGKADAWAEKLHTTGRKLEVSGKRASRRIGKETAPAFESVGKKVESGLDSFSKTAVGAEVEAGTQKLAAWNIERAAAAHAKQLGKAEEAMTREVPGFLDGIKNFVMRTKPATTELHPDLHEVASHIANAKGATGKEVLTHMEAANKALAKVTESTSATMNKGVFAAGEKESLTLLQSQIGKVSGFMQKSTNSANVMHGLGEAKNLSGFGKSLMKSAGNTKLFPAVMALTGAAALGAVFLSHKKDNLEADRTYNDIKADLGGDKDHPLLQNIEALHAKGKSGRRISTGMSAVSEVANTAMFMTPGGGGAGLMTAAMLPMVSGMFVHENPAMNAYANLKMQDEGKMELDPVQKLNFTKQLIAMVPSVAAHGGVYNRLVTPVAQEIVDRKLSASDVMKLLKNDAEFTAIASKALEEQKKAAAPEAAKVADAPAQADHHIAPAKPQTSAEAAYHAAEKPQGKVIQMQHEGKVETLQKTVAPAA